MALVYPMITRFVFMDIFGQIRAEQDAEQRRAHRVYARLERFGA